MNNKNLLLGYGETLTGQVKIEKRSGPKNKPYTYEENAPVIMRELQGVLRNFQELPDAVKPNGEAIAKITLHPAFLAKSYFPVLLFKNSLCKVLVAKLLKFDRERWLVVEGNQKKSLPVHVSMYLENQTAFYAYLMQ